MISPCKDCEWRRTGDEAGCHAECEAYKEWKKERERIIEARARETIRTKELPRKVKRQI